MNKINIYKCKICEDNAEYNYINNNIPEYCKKCKLNDMYKIYNYKKYNKCNRCKIKIAEYNYMNKKYAKLCDECKLDNMIYIKKEFNKCIKCNINETNKLYCEKCYDINIAIWYDILIYLNNNIKEYSIEYDQNINNELNQIRYFNITIDMYLYKIKVEIDENKYKNGNYNDDENEINNEIIKENIACVLLRYNPNNINSSNYKLLNEINDLIKTIDNDPNDIFDNYRLKIIYLNYDK